MKRRDLFRGAMAGAGAFTAQAQHAEHAAQVKPAPAPQPAVWKPALFDNHQNATVIALTDLIIPATATPGAKDARVNEYIDLILAEGGQARRARFIEGLGWLDGFAIREHRKPFIACSKSEQTALLKRLDGAKEPDLSPGAAFFKLAKQMTVEGYYTSRAGIAELNKGNRVPASFACKGTDH